MNFSPSFKHGERVFSYRFFGRKSDSSKRFFIDGVHLFAFTATPLTISSKTPGRSGDRNVGLGGGQGNPGFESRFTIDCQDPLLKRAFKKSKPLQNLIENLFDRHIRTVEIRQEVITAHFENPVRGQVKGKTNRICTENPADGEWAKSLRISLLKLSKIITEITAIAKDFKTHNRGPKPGRVFGAFFAAVSVFVIAAFFVNLYWYH